MPFYAVVGTPDGNLPMKQVRSLARKGQWVTSGKLYESWYERDREWNAASSEGRSGAEAERKGEGTPNLVV